MKTQDLLLQASLELNSLSEEDKIDVFQTFDNEGIHGFSNPNYMPESLRDSAFAELVKTAIGVENLIYELSDL